MSGAGRDLPSAGYTVADDVGAESGLGTREGPAPALPLPSAGH